MQQFVDAVKVVPAGKHGEAEVSHLIIGKDAASFSRIRQAVTGGREEAVSEGSYAQLRVGGQLVMSDTQMERRSNREVVRQARGDVLISGLGLGMILIPILRKPEVKSVLVLERSADVIASVAPAVRKVVSKPYTEGKLSVLCADVFTWKAPRGAKWDVIYHDIWANICTSNLDEVAKLHRKFGRRLRSGGWQSSWKVDELRALRRRGGWR